MERKYSKEALDFGDEIAGRRGGGMGRGRPFDSRGFGPPKSHTGDAAPKLNRAGKSTAPVEKLKSPSREFIDALSPKAKLELQHKLLPRTSPDYKGPPGPQSRASQTTRPPSAVCASSATLKRSRMRWRASLRVHLRPAPCASDQAWLSPSPIGFTR